MPTEPLEIRYTRGCFMAGNWLALKLINYGAGLGWFFAGFIGYFSALNLRMQEQRRNERPT